jgi:carboxymethylenebutenolidase
LRHDRRAPTIDAMPPIELTASDGHVLSAYRVDPAAPARGGVVVIQEIFGVNSHIRAVTEGFAAAGYLAVAPALFDRVERGVELGYAPDGFAEGRRLAALLDYGNVMNDVAAALDVATAAGKAGVVGYCYGGGVAWLAAARLKGLVAVVSYYGSRIQQVADEAPKVPVLMHVGKSDASFPIEFVRGLGARYPSVTIHEYDAGHGFNCDQRADFDAPSAELARERTLAFFAQHFA